MCVGGVELSRSLYYAIDGRDLLLFGCQCRMNHMMV